MVVGVDRVRGSRAARWTGEALAVAALASFGLVSIAIASIPPGLAFAGRSSLDRGLAIGAGLALMSMAIGEWRGPLPQRSWRPVLACLAWFVMGWTNPGSGSALLFTVGLVAWATWPAALADSVTADRRLSWSGRQREVLIAMAYGVNVLLLGFGPAVLDGPRTAACGALCPVNLVQWTIQPALAGLVTRIGLLLSAAWALAGCAWLGSRLIRASPAGRVPATLLTGPAIVALGLWAASAARSIPAGGPLLDEPGERLWQGQAAAIVAIAASRLVERWRVRRVRTRVSRIVLDLAAAPHGAGLRDRLAGLLDDPGLVLAYPAGPDRLVDRVGEPVRIDPDPARTVSPIVRDGEEVAVLVHRRELAEDPDRLAELIGAARLGLEAERLRALAEAALVDLRTSRGRVVAAGDAERRRLERDLHDTAQQRLVSLAIRTRRLRTRLAPLADGRPHKEAGRVARSVALLDQADAELRMALEQIREVAHGIDPAALSEDGLATGIEDLVEGSKAIVTVDAVPHERLDRQVEIAAFLIAREATRLPAGHQARIHMARSGRMLHAFVEHDGDLPELGDLEDRIGALDGTIRVTTSDDGRVQIEAEIPCAS